MPSPVTLSDATELHARLHDLAVVALRTRGRQRDLIAAVPGPSAWAGPAAVAYTSQRLTERAAALGKLADALDAVAGGLTSVARALPAVSVAAGVDARSSVTAVRQAQRLLAAADASPGPVDGVWGASSMAAVARVQSREGLPPTGIVDGLTALAISAAAAGGAVAVGGAPGIPHGLLPLAGSHPVIAAPAGTGPVAADPTADPTGDAGSDPTGDPTGGAGSDPTSDPTGDPTGDAGSDPTGDPTGNPTGGAGSDPTDSTDGGTAEGADPLPSGSTADGGTDQSPALHNLLQRLTPATPAGQP